MTSSIEMLDLFNYKYIQHTNTQRFIGFISKDVVILVIRHIFIEKLET